ncbi:diguanylate cyclase [Shewanella submarina]|uniref:Diguanylate cyclase domain-containing protein n=1 Tax=Shewanella submarina TaxID=2016376 RepID=A0ABV7GH33_9GAMM|nr:diguanylate cyclase [Shewanella submarina]MCL1039080.1 diguanylate cyclase [Shewanella submarina]
MKSAPIPPCDELRLERLRSSGLLDSLAEERFDRLTLLAKAFFNVPVCLISLVDEDRQWFKSNQGLQFCTETPRDISFCGHSILEGEVFLVEDAREDPRFADNPLVTDDPGIRFYAGYPLKTADGFHLGTLCIIDFVPRKPSPAELISLTEFGWLVEQEMDNDHLANFDTLTSLYNHRGFDSLVSQLLTISARVGHRGTFLSIELCGLTGITREHGSLQAEKALISFAACLRQAVQEMDIVARVNAGKFAIFLTYRSGDALVKKVLEKMTETVNTFNARAGKPWQLAFRFGVAESGALAAETSEELELRAETDMESQV